MESINEVLDKARDMCGLPSDNQLALRLKVTRGAVSAWRKERNAPDAIACAKLAEITGISLVRMIAIAGEARAISREEKAVWKRLASAAAVAGITLLSAVFFPTNGHANEGDFSRNQGVMHIM
jgi:transcriptional regulator with XRE-family HTH domain